MTSNADEYFTVAQNLVFGILIFAIVVIVVLIVRALRN